MTDKDQINEWKNATNILYSSHTGH